MPKRPASAKSRVNVAKARKTAEDLRAKRRGRLKDVSRTDRERLLGHFGPPVRHGGKKRSRARHLKTQAA